MVPCGANTVEEMLYQSQICLQGYDQSDFSLVQQRNSVLCQRHWTKWQLQVCTMLERRRAPCAALLGCKSNSCTFAVLALAFHAFKMPTGPLA
jgi:hypothetical protein